MLFCCLHFLWAWLSVSVVMAMPEPLPLDDWDGPFQGPPQASYPALDGPGGVLLPAGENLTEPLGELEAYCQLLLQAGGPPDQIPWFCLCTQCQGPQGPKGDQGDRGLPGSPGSPGRRGVTGFRGPPGFVGRPGVKGQKGDEGEKGDRGLQGFTGPKGGRGFKGDKGERGLEGRPGDQGSKGDDGVCPDACESVHVFPGPPGLPGPLGPRGLPGRPGASGPEGLKGDKGVRGVPGVSGSVGEKGEQGPQGECNCTDGADGAPGMTGDKGDPGLKGDKGQTGSQGDKGDLGQMGMMGPPGPCMPGIQSAFSAGLTASYPPPNTPVVFSHIHYNIQGSYDPGSGLYTAPVPGTYIFSYHLTVHERVLKVGLFHNFNPVVITTDPKVLGTTSHSVVLHLARGDQVWIQVKDSVTNGMYAGPESSSTFSGYLLHPDSCDLASLRGPIPPVNPHGDQYSWTSMTEPSTTKSPTSPAVGVSN